MKYWFYFMLNGREIIKVKARNAQFALMKMAALYGMSQDFQLLPCIPVGRTIDAEIE